MSQEEVLKESEVILNEMAHQLNLPAIRGFAFFLIKIFKALFSRIYVNEEGVQKVWFTVIATLKVIYNKISFKCVETVRFIPQDNF